MIEQTVRSSFAAAAKAVKDRSEEINKLNVFPVPDGDTGTNMALTLATVVDELERLPEDAPMPKVAAAVTHGSLMGARGNSGVITSQILRGLAEGLAEASCPPTSSDVAAMFRRAVKVAFQAVRRPVEGTILTVLKDVSRAADACEKRKASLEDTLDAIVSEAFDSVARTPDLLPVLKENGVVDSGAFGFSVFLEAFCAAALGREGQPAAADAAIARAASKVDIELNDDWEGSEFRYCTEFLFLAGAPIDEGATRDFLATQGDCELLVGTHPDYKIHVHTDHPDRVLCHMLELGQVYKVFIHNMDMEAHERTEKIAHDKESEAAPGKPVGVIAVAAGEGEADILRSLGVDVVVRGGQTMNPSTQDLLDAAKAANASSVIVLPDNSNIVMAAQSACSVAEFPMAVVPAKTVPQAFSAMFAFDASASLEENVAAMTAAVEHVHDGEVTRAVRESQTADGAPIRAGDVIGIVDGAIRLVGTDVREVALRMVDAMRADFGGETLTVLAGEGLDEAGLESLVGEMAERFPDLDVDGQMGGQPLYPVVLSLE